MTKRTYIEVSVDNNVKKYSLESFKKDKIVIGRKEDCDIIVDDARVSGHHGCFFKENGKWYYQDLNSTNGTLLNNKKIVTTDLIEGNTLFLGAPKNEASVIISVLKADGKGEGQGKTKADSKSDSSMNKWIIILSAAIGVVVLVIVGILLFKKDSSEGGGGAAPSGKHYGEVKAVIDKACVDYIEEFDTYYVGEEFAGFKGTFEGNRADLESVNYTITDANGVTVSEGSISFAEESWSITDPAMMVGENTLKVTAANKGGIESSDELVFVNNDEKYMENAAIDVDDKDEDGLIAYLEDSIGTDDNNPDTDGDGLSDYVEYLMTGTNPTLYDTLGDGICDADRDSDEDGLINKDEVAIETDPGVSDTDGDGLSDGEEANTHKTDPLLVDTDEDEASDKWEIDNGTDPLVKNGSFNIYVEAGTVDMPVRAAFRADYEGNPEAVCVEPLTTDYLLNQSMNGYMGSPYQVSFDSKIKQAQLIMQYNRECIPAGNEVAIYELSEETQLLYEVETSKTEDFTVTADIDHAATYVLLDKTRVEENAKIEIKTEEELENVVTKVAFVIDYSMSMDDNDPNYQRIDIVRDYLNNLRSGKDEACIVKFARYATTLVSMTSDIDKCSEAIGNIINNDGTSDGCGGNNEAGTNGSDGLKHALDEYELYDETFDMYRAIVFLTDGDDTEVSYDYDKLAEEAVQKKVAIYCISLGDAKEDILKSISEKTGGRYYRAAEIADDTVALVDIFDEIQGETIPEVDTNNDGINDYYTKKICDGELLSGTGLNPFEGHSYDEINSNDDFDGDGVKNGDEVVIEEINGRPYAKIVSSPVKKDSDMDGYDDKSDNRPMKWDVGDRDLAIFAAFSYEDTDRTIVIDDVEKGLCLRMFSLDNLEKEKMNRQFWVYKENEENDENPCEALDYIDFDYNENGYDNGILDRWVIADHRDIKLLMDTISYTVFQCDDNIVLAYRGTNGADDPLEWFDNIAVYGLTAVHGEEAAAKKIAQYIANRYPNKKLYITGHSLGGYLTQIGTAELLLNSDHKPERSVYFDGIGMNFTDRSGILYSLFGQAYIFGNLMAKLFNISEVNALKEFSDNGKNNKLISYYSEGDVVSSIGSHYGKQIAISIPSDYIDYLHNNSDILWDVGSFELSYLFSSITGKNIMHYYTTYKVDDIKEYFYVTHTMPGLFHGLTQGERKGYIIFNSSRLDE